VEKLAFKIMKCLKIFKCFGIKPLFFKEKMMHKIFFAFTFLVVLIVIGVASVMEIKINPRIIEKDVTNKPVDVTA
jgi:hypothetical protein